MERRQCQWRFRRVILRDSLDPDPFRQRGRQVTVLPGKRRGRRGTVRLVANGTLTNNGNVTSNGVSTNGPGGGGSGGSIWVTTGVLAGNGTFAANGELQRWRRRGRQDRDELPGLGIYRPDNRNRGTTSTAGDENGADGTVVHTYNMVYPNPVKRVAGVEIQVRDRFCPGDDPAP